MSSELLVYMSGSFVPLSAANISIFDSALMYGDMVFEVTRTFRQKPFRLRHHLERLYGSMRYAEIDCGLTLAELEAATYRTIEVNQAQLADGFDFQITHNVSPGGVRLLPQRLPRPARLDGDDQLLAPEGAFGRLCTAVRERGASGDTFPACRAVAVH